MFLTAEKVGGNGVTEPKRYAKLAACFLSFYRVLLLRTRKGFGSQIVLLDPGETLPCERGNSKMDQRREANITCLCEQDRTSLTYR